MTIAKERIYPLNNRAEAGGAFVLYWMQQSQRAKWNHALEFAARRANELKLPLVVCFGLTTYPEANARHYTFMLEGLQETAGALSRRGIQFVLQFGDPDEVALRVGKQAALIVCDRGYLRPQKLWRRRLAKNAQCSVIQVESDVIVPVRTASEKSEFAARTLRPKLLRQFERFLAPVQPVVLRRKSLRLRFPKEDAENIPKLLRRLRIDHSVEPVTEYFRGGTSCAEKILRKFLRNGLVDYKANRNQPQTDDVSHMSKYLHFGQISPAWLLLEARRQKSAGKQNIASFADELLIRRELAMNFCEFNENYDSYEALPEWGRRTLAKHRRDRRANVYSRGQLEAGKTHDRYWNAAMREMRVTGYMHNYMRMYWGKKIIEWSRTPEEAHATALAINNKYFLDGRDANSFANIAWLFGQHDRPWGERKIFGTVRYMNAHRLERKFDVEAYIAKVERMAGE